MGALRSPLSPSGNPSPQTPSRRFGEYELIAELARGGMGRVFLARRMGQAGFERLYALKIMHDHLAEESEAVTMLIDEANIASKIHHPNVVPITDIGSHAGSYYLVMDYVEGCTLSELLRRAGPGRSPRLVVPLIIDALRGLHAAHELHDAEGRSLGLIHRDFSPQNLLVGVDGLCRVADFGIAKASARLTHTRSTVQKGKISYMSPEQLTESTELDRRVDLWAAGVVLWAALTGEHPFRAESEASTIHAILERPVMPPSGVGLRPPRCFDAVCLRALERDPARRFASARAMGDELQAVAVRHDLLGPPSEIADWVQQLFHDELEARREVIRSVKDHGPAVTWIATPVLPRIAVTPSSGHHLPREERSEVARIDAPPPGPALEERAPRPAPVARPPQARRLTTVIGVVAGSLVGFAACLLVLIALAPSRQPDAGPEAAPRAAPADDLEPRSTPRPHAVRPEPVPAPEVAPAQAASTDASAARITLRGVPEGAVIRLDGTPVEGTEIVMPADGRERVIRVDAAGFDQWRQTFRARGSASFDVSLTPSTGASRPRVAPPRRRGGATLVRDPGF